MFALDAFKWIRSVIPELDQIGYYPVDTVSFGPSAYGDHGRVFVIQAASTSKNVPKCLVQNLVEKKIPALVCARLALNQPVFRMAENG